MVSDGVVMRGTGYGIVKGLFVDEESRTGDRWRNLGADLRWGPARAVEDPVDFGQGVGGDRIHQQLRKDPRRQPQHVLVFGLPYVGTSRTWGRRRRRVRAFTPKNLRNSNGYHIGPALCSRRGKGDKPLNRHVLCCWA